jgi:ribosomal protein S18 acetylase RimI-like enzyme
VNPSIRFSFDLAEFDFPRIHSWLASTYWSPGIPPGRVEKGFRASTLAVGAFIGPTQIGVGRALTDTTRFGYIADIFVDPDHRNRGIARAMARQLIEHPLMADVDACYLITRDAQPVYAGLGFEIADVQGRIMVRRRSRPD